MYCVPIEAGGMPVGGGTLSTKNSGAIASLKPCPVIVIGVPPPSGATCLLPVVVPTALTIGTPA